MANDVYFSNVPPQQNERPQKNAARRPAAQEHAHPQPGETPARSGPSYHSQNAQARRDPQPVQQARAPYETQQTTRPAPQRSYSAPAAPPQPAPVKQQKYAAAAEPPAAPKKKKHHFFRNFILFLLVFAIICAGGIAGLCYITYQRILDSYTPVQMQKSGVVDQSALMQSSNVYNILLMGVDQADADSSTRSDSMILLSIDKVNHKLKLTTFMRDMYVTIPGYGETKLNHACMYEGPQLTIDTIELNFGVRIDAYAKIGYDLFIELVNGVGGITVAEIDDTEARALEEESVYKEPGTNVYFTGEEAIKYVRIRHWQSDFARTERQRETITLIIEQAKKLPPTKLVALAQSIASKIECTVPKEEVLQLALDVLPCLTNDIEQQQIPAEGTWYDDTKDGLMVLMVDFETNKSIIRSFIYGG